MIEELSRQIQKAKARGGAVCLSHELADAILLALTNRTTHISSAGQVEGIPETGEEK